MRNLAFLFAALVAVPTYARSTEPEIDAAVTRLVSGMALVEIARTCTWSSDETLLQNAKNTAVLIALQGLAIEQKAKVVIKAGALRNTLTTFVQDQVKAGECSSKTTEGLWLELVKGADAMYPSGNQSEASDKVQTEAGPAE